MDPQQLGLAAPSERAEWCQGQIDLGIVRHHCGPREVEAKADELVKAPETSSTRLIGLIRLGGQLDLLAVIHAISRIDATIEPAMGHAAHLASRQAYFGHSEMSPSTTMVMSVMQPLWALAARATVPA